MGYPIASDSPEKTDVPSDNQDCPGAVPNDTASKLMANPEITHRVRQLRATPAQTVRPLALVATKTEPRVDSRLLAQHLGNQHHSVFLLLKNYRADFEQFGILRFQTEVIAGRGQPEKFALLNEDQTHLLLTYSRNTAKVRALKVQLVKAFAQARRAAQVRQMDYLPAYHAMQERIHELAQGSPNEHFIHMNVAKLVNKAAGVDAGQRLEAPLPVQSFLVVAQMLAAQAVQGATDRHEIQGLVKAALAPLTSLTAPQRLGAPT